MSAAFDPADLWSRLVQAGLASGEMPPPESAAPWYVRLMLGFAGWIGALFLLGFFGAALSIVFESPAAALAVGVIVCGMAVLVFRARSQGDFVSQFALAVSISGQFLVAWGLGSLIPDNLRINALLIACVQAALFWIVPDFVHRIWTGVTGLCALVLALTSSIVVPFLDGMLLAAFSLVWLTEFERTREHERARALGYSLAIVLVASLFLNATQVDMHAATSGKTGVVYSAGLAVRLLSAGLVGAVVVATVYMLLQRAPADAPRPFRAIALGIAVVLAVVSARAPGVGATLTMLVVGYAHGNRTLAGFAIAALLGYLSVFYYLLEYTLLVKSVLLMSTGIALLGAYALLRRREPGFAENERA